MPGKSYVGVDVAGLLYLAIVLGVAFLPVLLGRRGSPPDRSDSDSGADSDAGDGWGNGPTRPPRPPNLPKGGVPLHDAEPARSRIRDHGSLADQLPARERRPSREPRRPPVRITERAS